MACYSRFISLSKISYRCYQAYKIEELATGCCNVTWILVYVIPWEPPAIDTILGAMTIPIKDHCQHKQIRN
jgi:hypothetical protein